MVLWHGMYGVVCCGDGVVYMACMVWCGDGMVWCSIAWHGGMMW